VRDPSDAITGEGSQRHHGGERVREEGDTVETWSRGPEPSFLVDRIAFSVDQRERRYQSRFRFKDFLIRFGEALRVTLSALGLRLFLIQVKKHTRARSYWRTAELIEFIMNQKKKELNRHIDADKLEVYYESIKADGKRAEHLKNVFSFHFSKIYF
jgi:hypothetical protein